MRKLRLALVVTSIGKGDFLDGYCRQADVEGLRGLLRIIVIPDRKTPTMLHEKCDSLASAGFDILCPSLPEQESFLSRFGSLVDLVPYNSDNRRNIGFLMALDWGCNVLVSVDDDNYCIEEGDVFCDYAVVSRDEVSLPAVNSSNGWFNVCRMLEIDPDQEVYPRGFPYGKRHQETELTYAEERGSVRLNAGLWLGEPDLDAITWLAAPVRAKSFKGQSVLLGRDTWSPINTQNTSLHRDLIVAYYFVRMGYSVAGMTIDRFGDIFSGYFCQACVRQLGHRIRIGTPVALHKRNSHNYLRDLAHELACIWLLEDLTEWLRDIDLEGDTYEEAYLSLAHAIDHQVQRFTGSVWTDATRGYFHQMTYCMRQWVDACRQIG